MVHSSIWTIRNMVAIMTLLINVAEINTHINMRHLVYTIRSEDREANARVPPVALILMLKSISI